MSYYGQGIRGATAAEVLAAAATESFMAPAAGFFFPSIAKAWVKWGAGGTTIQAGFNVASISRSSAGVYQVNFAFNMTNDFCSMWSVESNDGSMWHVQTSSQTTTSAQIFIRDQSGSTVDPLGSIMGVFFGQQ